MSKKSRKERFQDLFKEIKADEAGAKREDAHWYGPLFKDASQQNREGQGNAPAAGKQNDHGREKVRPMSAINAEEHGEAIREENGAGRPDDSQSAGPRTAPKRVNEEATEGKASGERGMRENGTKER